MRKFFERCVEFYERQNLHVRFLLFFAVPALFAFAADIITKKAAYYFELTMSFNSGVSFGAMKGMNVSSAAAAGFVAAAALLVVSCAMIKNASPFFITGCGIMCGGALANALDRLRTGSVTDWIPIPFAKIIFTDGLMANVADFALCAGALLAVLGLSANTFTVTEDECQKQ